MLVDTSVWIDYFNEYPSAEAERLIQAIAGGEGIALPGIVLTEILLGVKTEAGASELNDLLLAFDILPEPSLADYQQAARLYRACRAKGITIRSTIDCLIAQLAMRDRLTILTKDRDFRMIAQLFPLQLVVLN